MNLGKNVGEDVNIDVSDDVGKDVDEEFGIEGLSRAADVLSFGIC